MTGTCAPPGSPVTDPASFATSRLLASAGPDLAAHHARHGSLPWPVAGEPLLREVEAAGLTGRGGAAFPTWRKLAAVATKPQPVVIANAAEGEPASAKDVTLLACVPHLVLDGLQLAMAAVGSTEGYLYVTAGDAAVAARRALAERQGRWDRCQVRVREAPRTFVAGEETAVIAALSGRPALPRHKATLAVESGLRGRPTLVHNVETLGQLALIARYGSGWFRQVGTAAEPGTFLATVSGAVAASEVVEVPYGIPLGELVALAGGSTVPVGAVLVGGYHGAWLPAEPGFRVSVSRAALAPWGASPGAGVVVALPARDCGLVATARIAVYLAGQSAGQCGPCLNGLPQLAGTLARLARGEPDPLLPAQVARLAALVEGRGACHHPDGTARMVRSALRTFDADVRAHLTGRCVAATSR